MVGPHCTDMLCYFSVVITSVPEDGKEGISLLLGTLLAVSNVQNNCITAIATNQNCGSILMTYMDWGGGGILFNCTQDISRIADPACMPLLNGDRH
jgi:hypothetical protein